MTRKHYTIIGTSVIPLLLLLLIICLALNWNPLQLLVGRFVPELLPYYWLGYLVLVGYWLLGLYSGLKAQRARS